MTLYCNTSGKPDPVITWTRVGGSKVLSNTSLLTVDNVRRPGNPDNLIQYQCTASNGVESPAIAVANVTVYCKSFIYEMLITRLIFGFDVLLSVMKVSCYFRMKSLHTNLNEGL